MAETGYRVELLSPGRETFEGRTPELALPRCLIFLTGENGEVGVHGFQS